METFWFCAIAAMLAVYAILDGFDLGAGVIYLFVAHNDLERRTVLHSIGPVWNGNEVWLIAGGGALFVAFPTLYASSFSGFYLPLTIVLWLLILRGIAIEFRSHIASPVWSPLWDAVFAGASAVLAILYGGAIGNVVRGVPLCASGFFFLPLWSNFNVGPNLGVLDWFTILVALATLAAMTEHGALWVAMKTEGELAVRCRRVARRCWWVMLLLTILVVIISPIVQPHLLSRISLHPWGYLFALAALGGLFGMSYFNQEATAARAFAASCLYLAGIVASTAFGLYPYVLPSSIAPQFGLTITNAAAPPRSLEIAIAWFIPGVILAVIYAAIVYRSFAGKVELEGPEY